MQNGSRSCCYSVNTLIDVNDRNVFKLYGEGIRPPTLRIIMVSKVVEHLNCTAGASACAPPCCPALGEQTLLPSSFGGLTAADTRTLCDLVFTLQDEWRCQIGRDGRQEVWVVVGARRPTSNTLSTFLIAHAEGRLLLIDISSEDRWKTLGCYDEINSLVADLGDLIGWHCKQ